MLTYAFIYMQLFIMLTYACIYSSKKPFNLEYKLYVELVETLTDQIIQRHNNYMATAILHDIDSNNWTDNKEFYEVSSLVQLLILVLLQQHNVMRSKFLVIPYIKESITNQISVSL